ncbi:MAG: aminotransferase class V-fold PLP-dependent enzyme [Bacteroidota bacterium]
MKDFKDIFPVTKDFTYLNTASCGLLSKPLVHWRHEHDMNLMQGGSMFRDLHKAHIKEIRAGVGRFFGTSEANVALVPNFSFGMNVALDGLSNRRKVLLLKGDYPSVHWPVESRDFEICSAEIDENLEANISEAMEQYQPDIFAFSIVQYISGILIDMDFLRKLKKRFPNTLFVADGTQFLGTTNFNFEESAIDVLGASAYKWLLAGYGNGVFLIKESAQGHMNPPVIGFNSADAVFSKKNKIEFIGHFEPGHQDTLNYGSLWESIQFMETIGKQEIENHLSALITKAKKAFERLDLLTPSVVGRKEHSTIFNLEGDAKLFQKLKENNIICSLRGKGIRVSFHFYNTDEDLDKLLSLVS